MTKKVLIVDDEKLISDILKDFLQRLGFDCHVFISADKAWQAISEQNLLFDLVITDLVMPGMNGMELIKKIEEQIEGGVVDTKFILMSGYRPEEVRLKDDVFLPKPFALDEVKRSLGILGLL